MQADVTLSHRVIDLLLSSSNFFPLSLSLLPHYKMVLSYIFPLRIRERKKYGNLILVNCFIFRGAVQIYFDKFNQHHCVCVCVCVATTTTIHSSTTTTQSSNQSLHIIHLKGTSAAFESWCQNSFSLQTLIFVFPTNDFLITTARATNSECSAFFFCWNSAKMALSWF